MHWTTENIKMNFSYIQGAYDPILRCNPFSSPNTPAKGFVTWFHLSLRVITIPKPSVFQLY